MAKEYRVKTPDGTIIRLRGPEDASKEDILAAAKRLHAQRQQAQPDVPDASQPTPQPAQPAMSKTEAVGTALEGAGGHFGIPVLESLGGTLKDAARTQRALFGEDPEAEQIIGGTIGGLAGGRSTALGSALAGLGGAAGDLIKQGRQFVAGSPDAPKSLEEAAGRAGIAAMEESGSELLGRGIGKAVSRFVPTMKEGIAELAKRLDEFGGSMTLSQKIPEGRVANWAIHQMTGLVRGSASASGILNAADMRNAEALLRMKDSLRNTLAKSASEALSDKELGELFIDTVTGGQAAHRSIANTLYQNVDDLAGSSTVDMTAVKSKAQEFLGKLQRIKGVGKGDLGGTLVERLAKQDDFLDFGDADFLRSMLLAEMRDLRVVPSERRFLRVLGEFADSLTESMEASAKKNGVLTEYRRAHDFWRKGSKVFDNKFVADLLLSKGDTPERIGETLWRQGNVSQIEAARKAILASGKLSRATDDVLTIDADRTWQQLQSGYFQSMINDAMDPAGDISGKKLASFLTKAKKSRTFEAMIRDPAHRRAIRQFVEIAETVQEKPPAGLGMVMNIAQGGAVIGLATGRFPGTSSAIFVSPWLMGHMLANPRIVPLMTKGLQFAAERPGGGQLAARLAFHALQSNDLFPEEAEEKVRELSRQAGRAVKDTVMNVQGALSNGG